VTARPLSGQQRSSLDVSAGVHASRPSDGVCASWLFMIVVPSPQGVPRPRRRENIIVRERVQWEMTVRHWSMNIGGALRVQQWPDVMLPPLGGVPLENAPFSVLGWTRRGTR
jgi:hypothetical protein